MLRDKKGGLREIEGVEEREREREDEAVDIVGERHMAIINWKHCRRKENACICLCAN